MESVNHKEKWAEGENSGSAVGAGKDGCSDTERTFPKGEKVDFSWSEGGGRSEEGWKPVVITGGERKGMRWDWGGGKAVTHSKVKRNHLYKKKGNLSFNSGIKTYRKEGGQERYATRRANIYSDGKGGSDRLVGAWGGGPKKGFQGGIFLGGEARRRFTV